MSILSGQDSCLQIGLGQTWGGKKKAQIRVPFMSESFKGAPNYKASEALVGAKTTSYMAVMSKKATGGFRTYVTPDMIKLFLYAALGRELTRTTVGGQQKHSYVPIPSGVCRNLPMLDAEVDRLLEKGLYSSFKINTWSLEANAEDFLYFECDGVAHSENLQSALVKTYCVSSAAMVLTLPADVLGSVGSAYVGKVVRLTDPATCTEYLFKITSHTIGASNAITLVTYPTAGGTALSASMAGWVVEILDWDMTRKAGNTWTPQMLDLSVLEYFKFAHARLYIEGGSNDYVVSGATLRQGRAGDTVKGVPLARTGAAGSTTQIIVEANDTDGYPCLYLYKGSAITRTTLTTLTFADAPAGDGQIKSIRTAAGVLNSSDWALYEELYDEITSIKVNGSNGLKDGKFGANGSMYQVEVQPQGREFTVDASLSMSKRYSDLRRRKMELGAPVSIRLEFVTSINDVDGPLNTSVDSAGYPYKLVVTLPSCYLPDGIPNISGPDEPTVSVKFQAREVPNVFEAITVDVYDQVAADIAGSYQSRDDGN